MSRSKPIVVPWPRRSGVSVACRLIASLAIAVVGRQPQVRPAAKRRRQKDRRMVRSPGSVDGLVGQFAGRLYDEGIGLTVECAEEPRLSVNVREAAAAAGRGHRAGEAFV